MSAIKSAYPSAKESVLNMRANDSICDTWECLANALYKGHSSELKKGGWKSVGKEKTLWGEKKSPFMDVKNNLSPSFQYFRKKLIELSRE